jgi:hypothetical protein
VIEHKLVGHEIKAFVLDDSVKARRGKKMAGIYSHFDHLTGHPVKDQQVLTLGYATEEVFFSRWIMSFISVRRMLLSLSNPFVMVAAMWQNATNRYHAHEEG